MKNIVYPDAALVNNKGGTVYANVYLDENETFLMLFFPLKIRLWLRRRN
jgi:hypothetical protein